MSSSQKHALDALRSRQCKMTALGMLWRYLGMSSLYLRLALLCSKFVNKYFWWRAGKKVSTSIVSLVWKGWLNADFVADMCVSEPYWGPLYHCWCWCSHENWHPWKLLPISAIRGIPHMLVFTCTKHQFVIYSACFCRYQLIPAKQLTWTFIVLLSPAMWLLKNTHSE